MIIATGNSQKGLAKILAENFKIDFFSRSNGYDLETTEAREKICEKSLSYSIFINNSKLKNFAQVLLLQEIYEHWLKNHHEGYIINVGSTCAYDIKGASRAYEAEKTSLRTYSLMLARHNKGRHEPALPRIRTTFVAPGWLSLEHVKDKGGDQPKIDPNEFCNIIKWLLDTPESLNVNEISVDALKEKN